MTAAANRPQVESAAITVDVIDARQRVVHVGDIDLPFELDEAGVPWVECEPYGTWLGYARGRDARGFALDLRRDGIINGSEIRAERSQNAGPGRPALKVWLTRKGAAKLAARSDTPRAIEMLDAIAGLFDAALDGRVVAAPAHSPALALAQQMLAAMVEQERRAAVLAARQEQLATEQADQAARLDVLEAEAHALPAGMGTIQLADEAGWCSERGQIGRASCRERVS
jgi:hypothetical protein